MLPGGIFTKFGWTFSKHSAVAHLIFRSGGRLNSRELTGLEKETHLPKHWR